ncbi:phosphodiester glycosidase family protein [Acetobacterium wieringae]|uniref:phosphodiester glycosidase family protein n=1 Tax=Acetobacterium wieringae TaxID=52694 RepID=UPI0026F152BC|nr:phosphodiester glycosidase family protein [Acetobacterium wieringae]
MITFFSKPYRWAGVFSLLLVGLFIFVLLDAFVIQKSMVIVASETSAETAAAAETEPVITATSYSDENIQISIETISKYDSTIYVADIQVSDAAYLKTAFANNTYGRNVKAKTSDIAAAQNAIFAINGDYYGFRDDGYVLRNGIVYRDSASENEALVIDQDGNFSIVDENEVSMASLSENWQVLSFGPALVENGEVMVDNSSEVGQAKESNPRTAIGQISEGHYLVIVSDGRTDESEGLSLLQLAQEFKERGCTIAYNLDGGGSSTMVFNGEVVNNPTDGRSNSEREVSDIVYFGY